MLLIGGEGIELKARIIADSLRSRFNFSFEKYAVNVIGMNALGKAMKTEAKEAVLQISAFDSDVSKLEELAKNISGMILSAPQGVAVMGGRPRVQEVVAYWPTLVSKNEVQLVVHDVHPDGNVKEVVRIIPALREGAKEMAQPRKQQEENAVHDMLISRPGLKQVQMQDLCLARSGDKGNHANVGVVARSGKLYQFLKQNLTVHVLNNWFDDLGVTQIEKYALDNLGILNFILKNVLDGGGTYSGRVDAQGKMLAATLLAQKVWIPEDIYREVKSEKVIK